MNMKHNLGIVLFLLHISVAYSYLTWIAVRLPLEGDPSPPGAPWPMPQTWDSSLQLLTLDPDNFQFIYNQDNCDIIDEAFERYRGLLHLDEDATSDPELETLEQVTVIVDDSECSSEHVPSMESDESYKLSINSEEATLTAGTIWGVLRGLETFSQLVYITGDKKYQINETEIEDFPRFPHRGIMIDTARHFIPLPVILNVLDAMSYNKMNVLHWHVVDDQSFPYPCRTFPNLTEFSTYSSYHRYSRQDVDTILAHARLRGIRVIPEFDTPGHTYSWGLALPDLITPCWGAGLEGGPNVPNYPEHGAAEIINPTQEYTYEVLEALYSEIVQDFPDDYVHLGMDEVYYTCWRTNPNMTVWMEEQGFSNYSQVEQYYSQRLINITRHLAAKYIIWEDPIHNDVTVDEHTLVQVWKDTVNEASMDPWQEYAKQIASKGYNMLLSSPWYLNMISYGQDWRRYYSTEPTNFTDDEVEKELMKGGEACLWAEYVDGTNLLSRMWPRASAVAERLWSASDVNDEEEAKYRLDQQRCRMVRRGIPAQPILNGYCGDYEWGADVEVEDPSTPPTDAGLTFYINWALSYFLLVLFLIQELQFSQ